MRGELEGRAVDIARNEGAHARDELRRVQRECRIDDPAVHDGPDVVDLRRPEIDTASVQLHLEAESLGDLDDPARRRPCLGRPERVLRMRPRESSNKTGSERRREGARSQRPCSSTRHGRHHST